MNLRPEIEILLCCARASLEPEEMEKLKGLLPSDLDWPYVFQMGQRHGLLSLLYRNLKNHFPDIVPQGILEQLRSIFYSQAGRNLSLTREVLKILDLLEENGIPTIPYKGPALGAFLYGDITLRPFGDLDFLVQKSDLPRAKGLLLSRGYQWSFRLNGDGEKAFLQSDDGCFLQRAGGKVFVEIDAEITPREFPISTGVNHFWQHTQPMTLEGRKVLAFSPEDLLVILCLHGSKHCWERLIWLGDLGELIRLEKGMDWARVMERGRSLGCERIILLGISLVSDLLHSTIPAEVLSRVHADPQVQALSRFILGRIGEEAQEKPLIGLSLTAYYLRLCDRWRHKAAFGFRLFFIPTVLDWEFLPLPSFLSFLYYLIHPLRLAGKYGRDTGRYLFLRVVRSE